MTAGSPGDRRRGAASHAHVCDCPDADHAGTAPATAPQVPVFPMYSRCVCWTVHLPDHEEALVQRD